jgi:hypothetical protein
VLQFPFPSPVSQGCRVPQVAPFYLGLFGIKTRPPAEKVGVIETAADFFMKRAGKAKGNGLMRFRHPPLANLSRSPAIRHLLLATLRIKAGFMALSAPSAPSLDAESATPTIRLVSRILSASATPSVSNAKLIPA